MHNQIHSSDVKKRLLIISNVPALKSVGGGIRNIQIIEAFKMIGYDVSIYLIYPHSWGHLAQSWELEMSHYCHYLGIFYFKKWYSILPELKIYHQINSISKNFDLIIFRFDALAFKSAFYFLKKKIIIDLDDYKYKDLNTPYQIIYEKIKRFIITKFSSFQFILEEKLKEEFPNSLYFPNLSSNSFLTKPTNFVKERTIYPSIIFVGSNTIWIKQFIEEEWDFLINEIENIRLFIISRDTDRLSFSKGMKGIEIYNNIDDLEPFYKLAWASIVPSKHKYGTLIKILESIFYKTPVICSTQVLSGYEFFNKDQELIMNGHLFRDLSIKLIKLLKNVDLYEEVAIKAYEIAFNYYSLERFTNNIKTKIYEK